MLKSIFSFVVRAQMLGVGSLVVALLAILLNGHRNDLSERNRNIRVAEFEILRNLAELQQMIDVTYFDRDNGKGTQSFTLSRILVIRDLAALSPEPVQQSAEKLMLAWRENGRKLDTSIDAVQKISDEIVNVRQEVVGSLKSLK